MLSAKKKKIFLKEPARKIYKNYIKLLQRIVLKAGCNRALFLFL